MYCINCNRQRKFEYPLMSFIVNKRLVLSVICNSESVVVIMIQYFKKEKIYWAGSISNKWGKVSHTSNFIFNDKGFLVYTNLLCFNEYGRSLNFRLGKIDKTSNYFLEKWKNRFNE